VWAGLRQLAAQASRLLLSRAQLASLELAQTRAQLLRWFGLLLLGVSALSLAAGVAAFAVIALLWPYWGVAAVLPPLAAFAALGIGLLRRLTRELREAPPPLSRTLDELTQDRDAIAQALTPRPPAP
jgi:uncharacterized membrane protein YqjE